jgi:hypothetical protein
MVPFAQSLYCRHPECGDYTVKGRREDSAGYALTA